MKTMEIMPVPAKFLFFTDIHFDLGLSKSKFISDDTTKWLSDQFRIVKDIFEYADSHGISEIFFGGDFFEQKNHLDVRLFNSVWSFIRNLTFKYKNINLVLNVGNHDLATGTRETTILPFSEFCDVVQEPTDYVVGNTLVRVVPFGMLSQEVLHHFDGSYDCKVIMTHEKIHGLTLSSGIILESSIKADAFSDFDLVLNGDIHKPQNLYENIINVGSPLVLDWSEADELKRFVYFEDGNIYPLVTRCPKWTNINYEDLTDDIKSNILINFQDYYRITAKPGTDTPIFNQDNVTVKYIGSEKKESRLKENGSLDEDIEQYVSIVGEDNGESLIQRGKELAYDIND